MKKIILAGLFMSVSMQQATTFYGITKLSDEIMKNVVIYGSAKLKDSSFVKAEIFGATQCDSVKVEDFLKVSGAFQADDIKCKDLSVHGAAKIKNGTIFGKTEVSGSCSIKNSQLHAKVHIDGSCSMSDVCVDGDIVISGAADFDRCTLKNVKATAQKVFFERTTADSIIIKENNGGWEIFGMKLFEGRTQTQTVYLKKGTVIRGDITFESGCGSVIISEGARLEGKVIGGDIKNK